MKILHLEDEPDDTELVKRALHADGLTVELDRVETRAAYEAALRQAAEQGCLDIILADYALPAFDGLDALSLAQELVPALPFIFVTGQLGEERAVETLKRGATDYVSKSHLNRVGLVVRRALREASEKARRERAEAAAATERGWLRGTLASIGDAVIATDTAGRVTFMNAVAEKLTGWSQGEAVGQASDSIVHLINAETRVLVESPVTRVLREGASAGLANRTLLVRRDGGELPIDDSGSPIRDEQGRLLGVVLVFRDVTERHAAELAQQQTEERFRTLVLATSAIVWSTDATGQFVTPQPMWEAYTGQPWEAQRGWGWLVMVHPDDRAAVEGRWKAAVAARKPYASHGRLWSAKGQEYCHFDAHAAPLLNADGSVREWIGTIADVNERELARSAARESEGRFRIMADTAPMLVWMAGPDGRCEFFNRRWLDFTGRRLEDELGDGWAAGVHAEDYERCLGTYRAAVKARTPFGHEYRLRRQDGEYRWMVDIGVPRFEADGRFAGFVGSCLDINERKVAEEALRTRARQQAAVAEIGQRALAVMELPALMDEVAQVVSRTLQVEFCKVLELQPGGHTLRLVAGVGWQPGLVGQAIVSAERGSQAGFTLLADEPVVVLDLNRETRFVGPPLLLQHGVVSGLSVIIRGGPRPWGVLGAHSAQPRDFGQDDVNFLQSIANVLAEAIARAQAEAALRVSRDQITAILHGVAEGVSVQAPDGRLVYANDAAARLVGYPSAEALVAASQSEIMGKFALFADNGEPLPLDRLPGRRALQGAADAAALMRFRILATGEERWSLDHAQPIFNRAGQVELAVSIFNDVTALKRAELTQRLLAEAGELLTRNLNAEALLAALVRLAVPHLADYCLVYQVEPDGQARAVARAHADPSQEDLLDRLVALRQPVANEPASHIREALLRQEAVLIPEFDVAGLLRRLPPELQAMGHLIPHSAVVVPLVARGRVGGVLFFARTTTSQPYQPLDLALAQELSRRAALALDNARLYAESQRLNAELEARVQARTEELHLTLEQLQRAVGKLESEIAERQEAENKFRNLMQAAPDATLIVDSQGHIVLANARAETVFGYTLAELAGQAVEKLIPHGLPGRRRGRRHDFVVDMLAQPVGAGQTLFGRHKDGHEFPVEMSLSPLQTPEGLLVTSAIRDITDRQQAEEQLRQSERQLAQAQQIARVGSWRWEFGSDTVTWSDELYRIYGLDKQDFPGTYAAYMEHIHPDDRERVSGTITAARRAGLPFETEHRIIWPNGEVRHVYSRGEVVFNARRRAVAMTGISQDTTDRERIEGELRASQEQLRRLSGHLQAAREEERARISREIHDELGGALTGLKMEVARLAKNAASLSPAEMQARTRSISTQIDGTVHTIRRIASDLRPGILDDFGLAAAIEWQLQEFGARAGLECDYQSTVEQIDLDPDGSTALFRLFQEALTNVARHAQATRVTARLAAEAGQLTLAVHDNGRGITPAEVANAKSLGLLGMRERVLLLSGQLSIVGEPGQGTTVLITIPLPASSSSPAGGLPE